MNIHLYEDFNNFGRIFLKLVTLITPRFSEKGDIINFYFYTSFL